MYATEMKKTILIYGAVCAVFLFAWVGISVALTYDKQELPVEPNLKSAEVMLQEITGDALYNAINAERNANGLAPFSRNVKLDESAKLKCDNMVAENYYEHKNPATGKSGGSYVADVGQYHGGASENLNQGAFNTAKDVIDSWMGSESHKASILDPKYEQIGFATCIVPNWPNALTVVQHKIVPPAPQPQPQVIQQQTQRLRTTCYTTDYFNTGNYTTSCY